jgi:antirestriction protein ArdC
LRYYHLFNICQTGIRVPDELKPPEIEIENIEPNIKEYVNRILVEHNITLEVTGDDPKYNSMSNTITMPKAKFYTSINDYYSSLFHQIGHAMSFILENDFRRTVDVEELLAESYSCIAMNHFNLDIPEIFNNSVAYIAEWIDKLKSNPRTVIKATTAADKLFNKTIEVI